MNPTSTEVSLDALRSALRSWCETLEALRITLVEDRPQPGHSALADGLADATDDVIGWLKEAETSVRMHADANEASRLVARAIRRQGETLFSGANYLQLARLARVSGGPWHGWVSAIRAACAPLWARTEDAVRQLPAASALRVPELSHTTYHTTHIRKPDTTNSSTQ